MNGLDRFNPLFEGKVPVKVEHSHRENEDLELMFRILSGKSTTAQGNKQDILHMEITAEEEESNFFLYTLQVSEEEFHDLKNDQCLLVDFKSFPKSFIELLNSCISSKSDCEQKLRFTSSLNLTDRPVLKIIEANQFKNLTHLALRFQPGTDQTIKSYLAGRLHKTSVESENRRNALDKASTELAKTKKEFHRVKKELEEVSSLMSRSKEQMIDSHNAELEKALARQKEESLKLLQQAQQASSEQALKQQSQANQRISDLEAELKEVSIEKNRLDKLSTKLKAENQTLSTRLEASENSTDRDASDLERLRNRNRDLEAKVFEYEKVCTANELSISALKQQLLDKEELLTKTTELLESGNERKTAAEDKLVLYKQTTQKLQRKLEYSIAEINKGNEEVNDENVPPNESETLSIVPKCKIREKAQKTFTPSIQAQAEQIKTTF